jgi:hypothetical protein
MVETTVRDRRKIAKTPGVKKVKIPLAPAVLGKRGAFPCNYCGKIFSTEKIVINHMCEQRRRFQQKDTAFARFGCEAFITIYQTISGKDAKKTEEDFRKSTLYLACMRWGHFVVDIKCFQPKQYLHWLLKRNIPIDNWDNDQIYDCWLQDYVFIEPAWDAFERSIKNMIAWGEETSQPYENYFKTAGTARIITDIRKIAVSGWSVFSSDSGKTWVGELELGDWNLVLAWLNPDRWAIQLTKYPVEVEKFSKMCKEAGL